MFTLNKVFIETAINMLVGYKLVIAFCVMQFIGSVIANMFSYKQLAKAMVLLRSRKWEKQGQIYQTVFRIKLWKNYIPAVGQFDKKHLIEAQKIDDKYASLYILEAVRAELTHLFCFCLTLSLLPFTASEYHRGLVIYGLVINFPCFIIQRYNIPRFERIITKQKDHEIWLTMPEEKKKHKAK